MKNLWRNVVIVISIILSSVYVAFEFVNSQMTELVFDQEIVQDSLSELEESVRILSKTLDETSVREKNVNPKVVIDKDYVFVSASAVSGEVSAKYPLITETVKQEDGTIEIVSKLDYENVEYSQNVRVKSKTMYIINWIFIFLFINVFIIFVLYIAPKMLIKIYK